MAQRIFLPFLLATIAGCGPLSFPAVQRLEPDAQAQVETAWANMLSPPGRLDRQTLLDVLVACQLHSLGIDRVHFVGEKQTPVGRVTLTVDFDRFRTDDGTYTFTLTGAGGNLIRYEHYTAAEVFQTVRDLNEYDRISTENGEVRAERKQLAQDRMMRVEAATKPSR
jgi:hypothetical protein